MNQGAVDKMLSGFLEEAALEFGVVLGENIGHEEGGTGEHWPGLPNRSSSPKQFPRKQSGGLVDSVYVAPEGAFEYAVGLSADHAFHLEGLLPSGGNKRAAKGNRYPLTRTGEDSRTHQRMNTAGERKTQ